MMYQKCVIINIFLVIGSQLFAQNENVKVNNCFNYALQGACEKALNCYQATGSVHSENEAEVAIIQLALGQFEKANAAYWDDHDHLNDTSKLIWDGMFLLSNGKYEDAISKISKYYDTDTTQIWCHFLIGMCYNQLGDTTTAFRHYWKIRLAYEDTPPMQLVGTKDFAFLQAAQFFHDEVKIPLVSRILFGNILRDNPDDKDAIFGIGTILSDGGDYPEVIRLLEPRVNTTEDKIRVYNLLGRAYRNTDDNYTAIKYYQLALAENPADVIVLNNLAIAYRTLGDYVSALHYYLQALNNDSTFVSSIYGAGVTYCVTSKLDSAEIKLDQLSQYVEADNEFYANLYYMLSDSLVWRSVRNEPRNPMSYYHLTGLYVRHEDYFQAEVALKKAIDLGCEEPDVHSWYAAILFGVIKPEEAVEHLEKWKDHEVFGPTCREFLPKAKDILSNYRERNE